MKSLSLSLLCPDCEKSKKENSPTKKPKPTPDMMRHHAVTAQEKDTKFCEECLHPYVLRAHYKEKK